MRRRDREPGAADAVADGAEDERVGGRVAGDGAAGLEVARVAVEDCAGDLVLHGGGEAGDGGRHDGGALGVAACDYDAVCEREGRRGQLVSQADWRGSRPHGVQPRFKYASGLGTHLDTWSWRAGRGFVPP